MKRITCYWLVIVTLATSWLGMMWLHELGDVIHAQMSGGHIDRVVLHPLRFSRTDVSPNPHPLFVAWGGPIGGVILPSGMWIVTRLARRGWTYLLRFFAGVCLVVNGAYIGVGWMTNAGDAGVIRALGTPVWVMVVFGLICCAAGLWMWHRLGPRFASGTIGEAIGVSLVLAVLSVGGLMN